MNQRLRRHLRNLATAVLAASVLVGVAAPGSASARTEAVAPFGVQALADAMLTAARQAQAAAQSQGRSPDEAVIAVQAAILGVVAQSGADIATILAALHMAEGAASDTLLNRALVAVGAKVSAAGRGCTGCTLPSSTGNGSQPGGAGTPAYTHRAQI